MDFSSSPSSSSYSRYQELARAASEGGIRPWLTVASPDMCTGDATTHTATATTTTTTTTSNNNNNKKLEDEDEAVTTTTTKDNNTETTQAAAEAAAATIYIEREHMFDKVVTPSDVGKLNRLVIPKQHAEKYFPLDSAANEKGLLLNFEDRSGKAWRFRYSYWNSSQSYVMTKGWSRFVKEKKLDAGDIISFQRGIGEVGKDRFFIDWRRRQPEMMPPLLPPRLLHLGNDHPGAAILFPAGGYHGISFNPSHYHHQGQYRYHQNHHHQRYLSSAAPNWSSNIGQPLIVRPPPPLPPPPPPLVQQQQLPVVMRDHYSPHYHGQMKQVNMINMVHQQQYHPGNQYQHDRNVNIVGRSSSGGGVGVHHNQYYHHQQQQYYNGNHHDQNNEYDHHGRNAVLSPPRGASCSSSIVYMNGSVMDPGRGGCRGGGGGRSESMAYGMAPVVQPREAAAAAAAPRQLRLFGVNMDCSISQADHDDDNVVFGVDVVAASQHHDIHNLHNRDDHDHQLYNSQNAAVSAPFQLRLYGDNPTNSISLRTSSQSNLQEKGKSSLSLDLGI